VRRGGSSGSAVASQHSDERKLRRAPKVCTFSPQDPRQRLPAGETLAEQKSSICFSRRAMATHALLFGGDDTFGCCCAACARDAIVGGSAALRWDERSGTWEHSASPPVAAAVAAAVSTGTGDGRAGYSWGTTVARARSRICDWSQDSTAYKQLLGFARSILGQQPAAACSSSSSSSSRDVAQWEQ